MNKLFVPYEDFYKQWRVYSGRFKKGEAYQTYRDSGANIFVAISGNYIAFEESEIIQLGEFINVE